MTTRHFAILLLLVTLLALGLRLHRLGDPSLWSDEIFQVRDSLSIWNAGYLPTWLGMRASGVRTGELDPERMEAWRAAGVDPFGMRLGTALVGTLSVPLLALGSAPWLSRRTALVLALLLATSTWHIEWSQQARHYVPIFLYSNLALALYASSLERRSLRWLLLALALALVAVASRATSLMIFGVIGLDFVAQSARERRLALSPAAIGAVAVSVVACLSLLAVRSLGSGPGAAADQAAFLARDAGFSPARLVAGNALLSGPVVVVLAAAGFASHLRVNARQAWLLAFVVGVPLASFALLAAFAHVEIRYTFANLFGWLALAAIGAVALYDAATRAGLLRAVAAAPLAMVLAAQGYALLVYYESAYGNRPRWNHAFAYVGRHWQPGETLYAHSSWAGRYYLESDRVASVDLDFEGLDALDRDAWFVVKSTEWEIGEGRPHWLDGRAELHAAYPTRTAFPQDTVRVYRYEHGDGGERR